MIGTLDPSIKKATIVGAGISGLLIAYALKKRGYEVEVLETSFRAGGLIQTRETPYGIAEAAAHSLLITEEAKTFFDELGLELVPINADSRSRYIYRNGKMRKMPLTFFEILQTIFHVFTKPKPAFPTDAGSLEEWGHAYLGQPATDFLLSPFVTGIFATSPKRLRAKLAFPILVPRNPNLSLFNYFRSRPKRKRPQMMTLKNGVESLVRALEEQLAVNIRFNTPITELPTHFAQNFSKPAREISSTQSSLDSPAAANTETNRANSSNSERALTNLILTVPTAALSKLIRKEHAKSAEAILQVPYAPLISVTCFYSKSAFKTPPTGVGVLIPRGQGLRLLGCLFNSSAFPNRVTSSNTISLTVMYGGTEDPTAMNLSDESLKALIEADLGKLLDTQAPSLHLEIQRWDRAIPVYGPELDAAQSSLREAFTSPPGQIVFSNYSKEVSIRSLIDASLHL